MTYADEMLQQGGRVAGALFVAAVFLERGSLVSASLPPPAEWGPGSAEPCREVPEPTAQPLKGLLCATPAESHPAYNGMCVVRLELPLAYSSTRAGTPKMKSGPGSPRSSDPPSRVSHLPCSETMRATLAHYAAGARHSRHVHDHAEVSFVLAGALHERFDRQAFEAGPGAVGLKPAGVAHADDWGPDGVLIFSVKLCGGGEEETEALPIEPMWLRTPSPVLLPRLIRTFVSAPDAATRQETLWDILALPRSEPSLSGSPPPWLSRARQAIHEAPEAISVAEAARVGGVHRVHFSRLFRRFYGVPPSVYRRRVLVARAVTRAVRTSAPLGGLAGDVGFSDQAHLSRAVRADVGLPPGLLRMIFRDATSVQAPPSALS